MATFAATCHLEPMKHFASVVLLLFSSFVVACGSDASPDARPSGTDASNPRADAPEAQHDAAPLPDAAPGVVADFIDCGDITPALTITVDENGPSPHAATVARGGVVRFDTGAHTNWEENGAWSVQSDTCLRMNVAATYTTYCYFHPQEPKGQLTVTP